jgi:hypothetical protein
VDEAEKICQELMFGQDRQPSYSKFGFVDSKAASRDNGRLERNKQTRHQYYSTKDVRFIPIYSALSQHLDFKAYIELYYSRDDQTATQLTADGPLGHDPQRGW